MKNVTKPRTVSFEDALRNLAAKLTGKPAQELPRTQEGVVQYMAETIPSMDEMAEAVTQEVLARLAKAQGADGEPQDPPADGEPESPAGDEDGPQDPEPPADPAGETSQPEAPAAGAKAKSGGRSRKSK